MKATLSILTLPQRWRNNQLTIRVLVMPRNFNPLIADQMAPGTVAWVDATMALTAKLISDPSKYPSILEASQPFALSSVAMPSGLRSIFEAIDGQFGGIPITDGSKRLQKANSGERARKYLPESYRASFNFTSVRTNDAALDDSYQCALREKNPIDPTFQSKLDLSWGKVFAYCLRQPKLAERVGFIYEATFAIDPTLLADGSWIYVDLDDGCSYKDAMINDQQLVKRYAAKLPKLATGDDRPLFSAVQFPVLVQNPAPGDSEDVPVSPSNLDELLIETAQYDDGFCKIVHANQPVSSDLLREKEDKDLPVITDAGIRLAWDDEQLLIWMNRQIKEDESFGVGSGRRTDAPPGVLQYRIDVRIKSDIVPNPNAWVPLCRVSNKLALEIGGQQIDAANNEVELGVEVYPTKPDAQSQLFWLPQYFANWIGKSLVLPDNDAIEIFKKEENTDPDRQAKKNDNYNIAGLGTMELLYGTKYEFRVRLADVTGGGPELLDNREYDAPSPEGSCDFRRMVQPQAVRLSTEVPEKDDEYFTGDSIELRRPLLGYPSVLFTGKYPNAIADLIADTDAAIAEKRPVGLPDPDVDAVEVLVEVKSLEMDMLLRYDTDSRESYAKLYLTKRLLPEDYNGSLSIPLTFVDANVLNFTDSQDLGTLGLVAGGDNIDDHDDIVLPKSRDIRITIRPVVKNKPEYYAKNSNLCRKGKPVTIITRREGTDERSLLKDLPEIDMIRALWLQPDTDTYLKATLTEVYVENASPVHRSRMIERLVESIDNSIEVESKGMSLVGKPGSRVQFGASRLIRNNLSPDSTSITIATKTDLLNQWIIPITMILDRDWTWDGLQTVAFKFYRQKKFVGAGLTADERNAIEWEDEQLVGDIEIKQAINVQALYSPDRSQTYLCFIDALEPKPELAAGFPEEMMVKYRIEANYKSIPNEVDVLKDDLPVLQLHLPMTTKPAQVPKIVSAGLAQSKYVADEMYATTEPRTRYLWLEFEDALQNSADTYFIRMLAYSPDPLLARWQADMFKAPEEAPLPINPEPVRVISPAHSDDRAGLSAMQELIPSDSSDKHFMVPLPPGLHAASPELFGFFTYEIRVGHKKGWSTAQARFGTALRTTGAQHPLPQLFCFATRNEKHIMVTAPYAQTVFDGANVTSDPPRTQLWALLYAQVKRADGREYRNVLLDDQLFVREPKPAPGPAGIITRINSDAVQYGITGWKNKDVANRLREFGLPVDSNLSVLVVEMLPTYERFFARSDFQRNNDNIRTVRTRTAPDVLNIVEEGMSVTYFNSVLGQVSHSAQEIQRRLETDLQLKMEEGFINEAEKNERVRPLTEQLGSQRILRTSTLTKVPEICCTEC